MNSLDLNYLNDNVDNFFIIKYEYYLKYKYLFENS